MENHCIYEEKDKIRPSYSASYLERLTALQFAAAELDQILTEKGIESVTTEWAAPFLFPSEKGGSLCFLSRLPEAWCRTPTWLVLFHLNEQMYRPVERGNTVLYDGR